MPQMNPMLWLWLFLMSIFSLILMMMILYTIYYYTPKFFLKMKSTSSTFNNKW